MPGFDLTKLFVNMINGKTGVVKLNAEDVHALPDDTVIPVPTYNQTTITSGAHDLDDYKTPGLYYFTAGTTLSNVPNSAVNGWLLVLGGDNGTLKQIWTRRGSRPNTFRDTYMRLFATIWGDWAKILTDSDIANMSTFTSDNGLSGFVSSIASNGNKYIRWTATDGTMLQLIINTDSGAERIYVQSYDGSAWSTDFSILPNAYVSGDEITFANDVPLNGFVTSSTKNIYLDLPVGKSLHNISGVSVTSMVGQLRGIAGYVDGQSSSSTDLTTVYTITATIAEPYHLRIRISKPTAFENTTNNTPVSFYGKVSLSFT